MTWHNVGWILQRDEVSDREEKWLKPATLIPNLTRNWEVKSVE